MFIIIIIFKKEMISRLNDILVKLSNTLPNLKKAHSFANPPVTLLSEVFAGTLHTKHVQNESEVRTLSTKEMRRKL